MESANSDMRPMWRRLFDARNSRDKRFVYIHFDFIRIHIHDRGNAVRVNPPPAEMATPFRDLRVFRNHLSGEWGANRAVIYISWRRRFFDPLPSLVLGQRDARLVALHKRFRGVERCVSGDLYR